MSIRKHKGGWQVDITNRSLGIRIRRNVGTMREAKSLESELRQQIKKQTIIETGIEHALTEYLKGEAKTLRDYKGLISKAKAIRPYIAGQTFESIGLVQAKIKKEMINKGLKPATINRRLALLRRLANLAFEWGWIDQPAGKRIKLLPGEEERHYYLSMEQVDEFVKLCPITGSLIKIAAVTGLRRKELQRVTPDTILKKKWIALPPRTKNGKPRMVPVPSIVRDLFDEYHWPLDKSYNHTLRKEFEAARKKLNLPHIRYHDLRHSFASFLIQNGASLKHVGAIMGHSSTQITNRYSHLMDENLMELAEKFASLSASPAKK